MDRRVERLPCRSNSIEQSRAQPWLVLGSCLSSEVALAWDEVGCMWSGSLHIGERSWSDCHSSDMVLRCSWCGLLVGAIYDSAPTQASDSAVCCVCFACWVALILCKGLLGFCTQLVLACKRQQATSKHVFRTLLACSQLGLFVL